jgi:hypothetical protein
VKAKLLDLEGKYYGTRVEVFDKTGDSAGWVVIWLNPTDESEYAPSRREIEQYMGDEWGHPTFEEAKAEYEICDSHYETQLAYDVATKLVEAINDSRGS